MPELNYFFNVEHEVYWGILIPLYFFYTGLSAGSFVISSLGTVFGIEKYKGVAKVGVLMAIVLLIIAPIHLIADLSQPARFLTLLYRVNLQSAMSWGVYLLMLYPLDLLIYAYFLFKKDKTEKDQKLAKLFGTLGVPLALAVHGYTGFILGNVQARALWHTALMPYIFLMSAVVSGTGMLILVIMFTDRFLSPAKTILLERRALLADIGKLLMWFIVADAALLFSHLVVLWYGNEAGATALWYLFEEEAVPFIGIELILGMVVPVLLLAFRRTRENLFTLGLASFLTMVGVLAMRINFVIGGLKIPLSGEEPVRYSVTSFELTTAVVLGAITLVALYALYRMLPIYEEKDKPIRPHAGPSSAVGEGMR
ncbi:NrfD/PsrC family molybdoenzyme membrane anchor subunit [Calderihabitans maritimus]|uniref:Oxidoreductase n=1 Tax=Calderihabitans maritimus TaxID=1246530 RepID=A0A1Z5HNY8_9FIRM|nr:NrfD/PsrC family molybdoenzyme membrane anchor subunit [Calderihabitans maritimus]GAW91246.1 oxidoreductase [Calderihabitans maritimus]